MNPWLLAVVNTLHIIVARFLKCWVWAPVQMYPENGSSRFVRNVRKFLGYMSHITVPVCISCCCCCYSCYHLYALYLQWYTQNKPRPYGLYCCSCSVVTICATSNVISPMKYVLYLYISTFRSMCAVANMAGFWSALISCFPGMLLR
jgi:hypothetical protein